MLYLENINYLRNYILYLTQENEINAKKLQTGEIESYETNKVLVIDNETQLIEFFHIMFPFFYSDTPKSDGALYIEAIGNTPTKTNNRINITKKKELILMDKIEKQTNEKGEEIYVKVSDEKFKFLFSSDIAVFRPIYKIREIGEIKKRAVSLDYISARLTKKAISILQKAVRENEGNPESPDMYNEFNAFVNMLKHLNMYINEVDLISFVNQHINVDLETFDKSYNFFAEKAYSKDNLEIFFE